MNASEMTPSTPAPTVEVGQVYRLIDENPFSVPQHARVLDVKGAYVKYLLKVNETEFQEHQYNSGTIASFISRYELLSEADAKGRL